MTPPANKRFAIQLATAIGIVLTNVCTSAAVAHPRPQQPIQNVRATAAWSPDSPGETPYSKGKRLLAAGDAARALTAFQQALAAAPNSADALNGIGVSYDRLGRMDLAEPFYTAALSIDPDASNVENNLGYSLYLSGRYADAVPHLKLAAGGGDREAASASRRTLTLIDALNDAPARPVLEARAAATPVDASVANVERTSEGEQRLVIGAAPATAGTMRDERALLATVARPWTAEDDRLLLAKASEEEMDEANAARAARPLPEGSRPKSAAVGETDLAGLVLATQIDDRSTVARGFRVDDVKLPFSPTGGRRASGEMLDALARPDETSGAIILGTRRPEDWVSRGPQDDRRLGNIDPFDSDDPILNAFASRMQALREVDIRAAWS